MNQIEWFKSLFKRVSLFWMNVFIIMAILLLSVGVFEIIFESYPKIFSSTNVDTFQKSVQDNYRP